MGNPTPRLTPGKLAWLEQLEREGVANRPRGNVGRNCMVNGWIDWACRMPCGSIGIWRDLTTEQRHSEQFATVGEMLTEAGRRRLAEHRNLRND